MGTSMEWMWNDWAGLRACRAETVARSLSVACAKGRWVYACGVDVEEGGVHGSCVSAYGRVSPHGYRVMVLVPRAVWAV
jgi:hypothetical protein